MYIGRRPPPSILRQERGIVLIVALVALLVITLAGFALLRAVDTGNLIAGNLSFYRAATQNSFLGSSLVDGSALPTDLDGSTANYLSTMSGSDPTTLNWDAASCVNDDGTTAAACNASGGYRVKRIIERLCSAKPDGTRSDIEAKCLMEWQVGGSSGALSPPIRGVVHFYRVNVQVIGPKNTVVYTQSFFKF